MSQVFAFNVWAGETNYGTVVNACTAGSAKADYLRDVRDCWPDVKFTDMRARKLGPAQTSEAFLRTARYRGMPDLRCGEAVTVNGRRGFIVGHNDSANFDVLFDEGDWKGCTLNCHPSDIRRLPAAPSTPAKGVEG